MKTSAPERAPTVPGLAFVMAVSIVGLWMTSRMAHASSAVRLVIHNPTILTAMTNASPGTVGARSGADVFISYARENRGKARVLVDALRRRGLDVWWDPEVRTGDSWAAVIEAAVTSAPCVIVLWSKEAVESRWVNAEARLGLRAGKLVPVCLDETEPPLVFCEIQHLSLAGWDGEGEPGEIERLVDDARGVIARSRGGAASPSSGERPPRPWSAIRALAAGVAVGVALVWSDGLGALLEAATDMALRAGLPLPPVVTQAVVVAASGAFLLLRRRRFWPLPSTRLGRVFVAALVFALGAGVLYRLGTEVMGERRDHLIGRIQATERQEMRVQVLDSLQREMSPRGAAVDSDDGAFVLRFAPVLGDRPRQLVMSRASCAEQPHAIGRRLWRQNGVVEAVFTCREEP